MLPTIIKWLKSSQATVKQKEIEVEKLKENKCLLTFYCTHTKLKPCVYFSGDGLCKYTLGPHYICSSAVAQANVITLRLKELEK
ncbi:MAG: hypothetical protein GY870_15690 [archaeon]|nr:hypothetical protein [archaeon]